MDTPIKIVAVTGAAGSGKSEVAKHLIERHGFTRVKFADPLKRMLSGLYESVGSTQREIDRKLEGDLKERPCPILGGFTPRWAMQSLGTEWGREEMGNDFWLNLFSISVHEARSPRIVVDDVRFSNEAVKVIQLGGEIWKVYSPKQRRAPSSHPSEVGIPEDLVKRNIPNLGSLEDLQTQVSQLILSPN